ncbi:MAG: hypothetical protein B7C55_01015, partial [Actinomycetales bacterium mxb001]
MRIHSCPLPETHIVSLADVPVTTEERTALDLARTFSLPEGLICLDRVMRRDIERSGPPGVDIRFAARQPDLTEAARDRIAKVLADAASFRGAQRAM